MSLFLPPSVAEIKVVHKDLPKRLIYFRDFAYIYNNDNIGKSLQETDKKIILGFETENYDTITIGSVDLLQLATDIGEIKEKLINLSDRLQRLETHVEYMPDGIKTEFDQLVEQQAK